ncbi:hypothetical protein U1Q18_015036, partial [Sarracenia purpurea var. burkii]
MLLITKRRKTGTICGHAVNAITKSKILSISHFAVRSSVEHSKNENRILYGSMLVWYEFLWNPQSPQQYSVNCCFAAWLLQT